MMKTNGNTSKSCLGKKEKTGKPVLFSSLVLTIGIFMSSVLAAQEVKQKLKIAVLNIDTKNINIDPVSMGNIVRLELEKMDSFEVADKYDVNYVAEKNKIALDNCYGKICLVEIGALIHADKILTGSVELMGKSIVVSLRQVDVKNRTIEKTLVREFLDLPQEVHRMVKWSVDEFYNRPLDKTLMSKLTLKADYDSEINNPNAVKLELDGPRMGFTTFSGGIHDRMVAPKANGGFDAFPVMFQFGYQFEKQYLNEGKVQALFEFIPNITGLDQGYFFPSFTLLHGVRSNINGWEFAFGPTFAFTLKSNGYYDDQQNWHLKNDWVSDSTNNYASNPYPIVSRLDSRGELTFTSSFLIAFGRTFKSGKLNIPVNIYAVPSTEGWRMGLSFGFNAKNKVVTN